jgi:hypothetical protein
MTTVIPRSRTSISKISIDETVPRVEIARRFVRKHDAWVVGDGVRDAHALLLAARELVRPTSDEVRKTHLREHGTRMLRRVVFASAAPSEHRDHHVFEDGELGQEEVSR